MTFTQLLLSLAALLGLSACASLPAARMALPDELGGREPVLIEGLGAGRSGSFSLDGRSGRFEREADRLALFSALSFEQARTRFSIDLPEGGRTEAACRGKQTSLSAGALFGRPRPFALECRWRGAMRAELSLQGHDGAGATRQQRQGQFSSGALLLQLQSVHRVQGSPLPLEAPIGYLISHEGRPVAALELNGRPRLWRPAAEHPAYAAVNQAALALALLWDPAHAQP